jgi:hypothetical protein
MRSTALLVGVLVAGFSSAAVAHGGGLNAEGCHHNRKTGDYHCHRAPTVVAPQAQPAVPKQLKASYPPPAQAAVAPSRPATPTCYVGPRGGTYTITASGRKNYSEC